MLTPEGKKEALGQLKNTMTETSSALKQAKATLKQLEGDKAAQTKDFTKHQKTLDKSIEAAKKQLAKAEARHEVSVKALAELKAQPVEKPVKAAKPATAAGTVQSALSAPTSTVQ